VPRYPSTQSSDNSVCIALVDRATICGNGEKEFQQLSLLLLRNHVSQAIALVTIWYFCIADVRVSTTMGNVMTPAASLKMAKNLEIFGN
jgi:hypothetical protein